MRDIKTLLEILLDQYQNNRIDGIQWTGLCLAINRLLVSHVIDQHDEEALLEVIKANKPDKPWSEAYWWPRGHTKPRIEFLQKLISKL